MFYLVSALNMLLILINLAVIIGTDSKYEYLNWGAIVFILALWAMEFKWNMELKK